PSLEGIALCVDPSHIPSPAADRSLTAHHSHPGAAHRCEAGDGRTNRKVSLTNLFVKTFLARILLNSMPRCQVILPTQRLAGGRLVPITIDTGALISMLITWIGVEPMFCSVCGPSGGDHIASPTSPRRPARRESKATAPVSSRRTKSPVARK